MGQNLFTAFRTSYPSSAKDVTPRSLFKPWQLDIMIAVGQPGVEEGPLPMACAGSFEGSIAERERLHYAWKKIGFGWKNDGISMPL